MNIRNIQKKIVKKTKRNEKVDEIKHIMVERNLSISAIILTIWDLNITMKKKSDYIKMKTKPIWCFLKRLYEVIEVENTRRNEL